MAKNKKPEKQKPSFRKAAKNTKKASKYQFNLYDKVTINWLGNIKNGEIINKEYHPDYGKCYQIHSEDNMYYPYIAHNEQQNIAFGYIIE
jgi:hypothetical protein